MFDAIVLAGAGSRRLDGADKAAVEVNGRTLLDIALAATDGAQRVVVAGPQRPVDRDVVWVQEQPPGGGPVAGIAAAVGSVSATWTLVLATDLPRIGPAVPLLLTAAADVDVAVLSCDGRRNYLAAVWRTDALRAALDAARSRSRMPQRAICSPVPMSPTSRTSRAGARTSTPGPRSSGLGMPDALSRWVEQLCDALQIDAAPDRDLVLDLARDAAHGVARPAAPLTTFLVGLAAGLRGGSADDVAAAAEIAKRLAADWDD